MRLHHIVWIVGLCACASNESPASPQDPAAVRVNGDIEYRAQTLVMESFPVQLRTIVTLTNRSDRQAAVSFSDGCVVLVRAFRDDRTVWDQRDHIGCTLALVGVQLAPGQVREFQTSTDARQILGTSLPDGKYRLEAYLRPVGASPIELSAGNVDLAVPRN